MKKVILRAKDNYKLNLHVFEVENSKGFIQVIHGMEEHQERYEAFIEALNEAGYTVVSSDMRGHGMDAPILGYFKERNGYKYLISDQRRITHYIKKKFNTDKVIIFAHSMGTIIARNLLQTESEDYEKVIMSGYPYFPGKLAMNFGKCITDIIAKVKGGDFKSDFVQNIAVGHFNKSVENPNTELDWISVNEENVQNYINDEYCGHGFTVAAFNDLFQLSLNMAKSENYKNVNANLPILALRGKDDPCTGFKKGSMESLNLLKKVGFENIKAIVYPNMRHEILNEDGNKKVYKDIIEFLGN